MDVESCLAAAADVVTPVAALDEAVLERNLARMQRHADAGGLRLRPHAKTHKSSWIARRQLALGASGLTVATLQEAEVFGAAGADDILLAHPPVGEPKLRRLTQLAGRVTRLAVALDDAELAMQLPPTVDVMWEVDSGQHRLGTPAGPETWAECAQAHGKLYAVPEWGPAVPSGKAAVRDIPDYIRAMWEHYQGWSHILAYESDFGNDNPEGTGLHSLWDPVSVPLCSQAYAESWRPRWVAP